MADDDLLVRARLQNELSAGLRTIQGDLARTTRTAEALAAGTGKAGTGLTNLESRRKGASAGLKAFDSDLRSVSTSLSSEFTSGLKTAGTAVALLTGGVAAFGLKSASNFQQSQIAFETLLGSVSAGDQLFKQLQQINVKTPFQLKEIAPATQLLLRYGVAADKVVPVLKSLLDAAALSGDPAANLQRLALATGQVVSQGRLLGQDARQLAESGINAYDLFAQKLGLTADQVRKLGQAGKLSSQVFLEGLINEEGPLEKLRGGAEKLSGTLLGQFSNLWDTINIGLADSAQSVVHQFTRQMPTIQRLVGTAVEQLGPPVFHLVDTLAQGAIRLLPVLAPILTTIVSGFDRLLTAGGPALTALEPLSGVIGDALVQMVTALVPVMPDVVGLLVAMVKILPDMIRLLTAMIPIVDPIVRLITAMLGFDQVRTVVALLLIGLLAYRRVSGLVGGLMDFGRAIGFIGTTSEVAGTKASIAYGKFGALAALGLGVAGVARGLPPVLKGKSKPINDFELIGGAATIGGVVGGVPGALIAGGAAAAVDVGAHLVSHFFGDPVVPGQTMNRHLAAAGGNPNLRITSGMRGFGLRSSASGHARGTAVDVAGSGLVGYVQRARAMGGWATIENHGGALHAHADFGDAASGYARSGLPGGGSGSLVVNISIGQVNGQVDFERGVTNAVKRLERDRQERAYNPPWSRTGVA